MSCCNCEAVSWSICALRSGLPLIVFRSLLLLLLAPDNVDVPPPLDPVLDAARLELDPESLDEDLMALGTPAS